ncbi:MAG: transposase, partial [Vicinamibacteria bacterium]
IRASAFTITPPSIPATPRGSTLARRSLGEGGKLACYWMRSPVNLSRLRYHPKTQLFLYQPKAGHELDDQALLDPLEFLARVLIHVPEPNRHRLHFYGVYANRVRASYRRDNMSPPDESDDLTPPRRSLSRRWAQLIDYGARAPPAARPAAASRLRGGLRTPQLIAREVSRARNGRPRFGYELEQDQRAQ